MRVALSKASIGLCRLTARYRMPLARRGAAKRAALSVPLILPAEGELLQRQTHRPHGGRPAPEVRPGPWTAADAAAGRQTAAHSQELTAARPAPEADLDVQWEDEGAAIVERAWVQTWLAASVRPGPRRLSVH